MNRQKQDNQNVQTRDPSGKFIKGRSGNPNGRPANAEAIRLLLAPRTEELVAVAVEMALSGDSAALKLCLERISAPVKSELPSIEIPDFELANTPLEKANRIINAVGKGQMSIEIGERFLAAISFYYKIYELDQLEKRIETLEIGKNE